MPGMAELDIVFFYVAEAYQSYHSLGVAFALAERPGVRVSILYNDPAMPHHVERVRRATGARAIPCRSARLSPLVRLLRRFPRFGLSKRLVMRGNARALRDCDAIVAVENTAAALRDHGVTRPRLVYIPHGSGDRARSFVRRIATFDLVLPAGPKNVPRFLTEQLIRPGGYALPGYVKLDTAAALVRAAAPLFADDRPVVLYNPHAMRDLSSWDRFADPLIALARANGAFNLVVAPHVKLFARRPAAEARAWEAKGGGNVLVDLGSDRSVDLSYTVAADIYVGDVSSQVYEFLARPRPCVFLNAHGIDWQGDPDYRNWTFGEVIDDPADLAAAIARAPARHAEFRALQEEAAAAALGDRSPGSAARAADAILAFMAGRDPAAAT